MALSPKDIEQKYERGVKAIYAEIQDYWINSAFIRGKQWVKWDARSNKITAYEGDPDRVQAVNNRIWPASRTIMSKILQRPLAFEVLPSEPDDATMRGASTAEAVLEDIHYEHKWESLREVNALSTWLGGTAAICVDWDPSKGRTVDGTVREGDTVETPLSIAEFVLQPGVKNAETAHWWVKAQALPPESVKNTYNLKETPPSDATNGLSPLYQSWGDRLGDGSTKPELTRVLTYYERPHKGNPEGTIAVVINGKFAVQPKKWPFPFTERLNLALTFETRQDQKWAGETVVTQARPVQMLLNLAESNIAEHMKNAGTARMFVPQSVIDAIDVMSDLPGEMLPIPDGSSPPVWSTPPSMPNWWAIRANELSQQIDDLLGWHEISRGDTPANIESGYGLSILAEHDASPVGRMVTSQAAAFSDVATMVLQLYAANVQETRTSMVRSGGDVPEQVTWSGRDLAGQTQAVVPQDAVMPRSRAAAMATAEKMVQMGLVQDVETFAALTELPGAKDLLSRIRPDAAKARRENSMMALGRPQVPADFDDHQAHIAEHNVFRKSARYERLSPDLKGLVDTHIQAHSTMAGELAGKARAGAAIDPMLSTVPQADSRPTIPMEAMPPDSLPVEAPGADLPLGQPATPLDELAMLAQQAADI